MEDVSNLGERVLKQQREARCSVETAAIPISKRYNSGFFFVIILSKKEQKNVTWALISTNSSTKALNSALGLGPLHYTVSCATPAPG